jgi:hypothetical protein
MILSQVSFMPSLRSTLLTQVERFLTWRKISATRFGYLSCGDPGFVRKLRSGGDFRASTMERVINFMGAGRK